MIKNLNDQLVYMIALSFRSDRRITNPITPKISDKYKMGF